jgi:hypothetical protein
MEISVGASCQLSVRWVSPFNGDDNVEQRCSTWRLPQFGKKEHLDGTYDKIDSAKRMDLVIVTYRLQDQHSQGTNFTGQQRNFFIYCINNSCCNLTFSDGLATEYSSTLKLEHNY